MILAIDSAIATAVAIVTADGEVLAECPSADTRGHAEAVGRLIAEALERSGVPAAAITAVAAGMGPGAFTGLRVGIAAARAFAIGRGIPVISLPSHDAIALDRGLDVPLVVLTDVRRREFAWTAFSGLDADGLPVTVAGPSLAPADDLDAALADHAGTARVLATAVPAGALGRIAARRIAVGAGSSALEPLYLRAPDAIPSAGPKRVTA